MTTWPNWVDLLIVILLWRTCYSGFNRGILGELISAVGALSVTAVTIHHGRAVAQWMLGWLWFQPDPILTTFLIFWAIFLILALVMRVLIRRVSELVAWERLHWSIQGIGMMLGGVRGLWWSGVLVLALVSSGFTSLKTSVEERSLIGPHLLPLAQEVVGEVVTRFPLAPARGEAPMFPLAKEWETDT